MSAWLVALGLLIASPFADGGLADVAGPCLTKKDCGRGLSCVRTVCTPPDQAWSAPPPVVGLRLGDVDTTCPGATLAALAARDRLAAAVEALGMPSRVLSTAGDADGGPLGLDVLNEALEKGVRALVRVELTCRGKGKRTRIRWRVYDVSAMRGVRRLTTTLTLAHPTVPARAESIDELANRLRALDGGPDGSLGSRIAIACRVRPGVKEIFSLDARGGGLRRETRYNSLTILPAWTRDGRIAVTTYARGNPDVHLAGHPLISRPGLNTGIDFDKSGRRFVLASGDDGATDIWLGDVRRGRLIRQLTKHPGIDTSPQLSPDGRRVVFVSDRGGSPQVYVLAIKGGEPTRVSERGGYNASPAWSPDGHTVAWTRRARGARHVVVTADIRNAIRTERVRARGSASYENPSFSPDGRLLAMSEIKDSQARPVLLDLTTGDIRPLATVELPGSCTQPAWGPRRLGAR